MPKPSAFPIVASNAGQIYDYGLTAREMIAAVILSGSYGNAQEHVDDDACRCHVEAAVRAADMLLSITRGG